MVKIQSGTYRGKQLPVPPKTTVRPTKSLVRSALFNMLRSRLTLTEYSFFDIFAGSGIIGFEALSNGCQSVVMFETDKELRQNLERISTRFFHNQVQVIPGDAVDKRSAWSPQEHSVFFLDPPYLQTDLIYRFLAAVRSQKNAFRQIAWHIIVETNSDLDSTRIPDFSLETQKQYGISKLYYFTA